MAKKENNQKNYQANEAWRERKRASNALKADSQRVWRSTQLLTRAIEGRTTDKNRREASAIGLEVTV